jgi:Asp-tRNAAsn/Glu-tRNAGln amidotransferase A subunit and related amidases
MKDIACLSATEMIGAFRAGALSPVEVLQACFERIDAAEPVLNAFTEQRREDALAAAEASHARWARGETIGIIDGVPTAIKDLTPQKGFMFRRGSKSTGDEVCLEDAPCVKRLREEGAVFVGKTTTPEFGWKGVTDSPLSGITRNPWDPDRTPGGSSGGASAAVATGMCALAEGTDGGGSIRMPAGFTGIFGLYPTAGRIPYYPLSVLGTMSQCGPMTRTVSDGALMFTAMSGPDPRDPIHLNNNEVDWRAFLDMGVAGLRVAYSPTLGFAKVDEDVAGVVEDAVATISRLGARVTRVDHVIDDPREPYEVLFSVGMERIRRSISEADQQNMDPGLLEMAAVGRTIDTFAFAEALLQRDKWAAAMNAFFTDYDVLVTPQLPLTAFKAGLEFPKGRGMRRWLDWNPFGYPFNFTNSPGGTMPCGFGDDGMPVAFQVIAPRHREDLIFRVCRAYEKVRPIPLPDIARLQVAGEA